MKNNDKVRKSVESLTHCLLLQPTSNRIFVLNVLKLSFYIFSTFRTSPNILNHLYNITELYPNTL